MSKTDSVDWFSQELRSSPYPVYAQMRDREAVSRVRLPSGTTASVLTRYADVRAGLANPDLSREHYPLPFHCEGAGSDLVRAMLFDHMLRADGSAHSRVRRLATKAFTACQVGRFGSSIREIADQLIDRVDSAGSTDLVSAFAQPLPMAVISTILGAPQLGQEGYDEWAGVVLPVLYGTDPKDIQARSLVLYERLATLIEQKKRDPGTDLTTALIHSEHDGDRLSDPELVATIFLIILAGQETTANLVGNALHALLSHPRQWAAVRADPALLPAAIDEILRYESSVHAATARIAVRDVEVGAHTIPAGEIVILSLASANRDCGEFVNPDQFDVTRSAGRHLGFGQGPHYCLGARLARLEAAVGVGAVVSRWPELALAVPAEDLRWHRGQIMRGLVRLPVVWSGAVH